MKLDRIVIENVRMYRGPVAIDGLHPGLNLFVGPNGSGKSTLLTAIRAAFLERHRSSVVDHLRPRDDKTASPRVDIDFTIGDAQYRLEKTFLGRKRCVLSIDTAQLDGEEAEDHLAELLGYSYPGRGASKGEHWGIPGLLWIQQGSGQEVEEPVKVAGGQLQNALQSMLGSIASSDGDAVIQKLYSQREALVTSSRGEPRGSYLAARTDLHATEVELRALDDRIRLYRNQVDMLTHLQSEWEQLDRERPWKVLEEECRDLQQQVDTGEKIGAEIAVLRRRETDATAKVTLFSDRLVELQQLDRELIDAEKRHDEACAELETLIGRETTARDALAAADRNAQAARTALELAKTEDRRSGLKKQLDGVSAQVSQALSMHDQAVAARRRVDELNSVATSLAIDANIVANLRRLSMEARDADLRLQAVGTRLEFDLTDGVALPAGPHVLSGRGDLLLTEEVQVDLSSLGFLRVCPGGGEDLEALARRANDARGEFEAALARAGVVDLAAAEARESQYREALHNVEVVRVEERTLAPDGLHVLVQNLDELRGREAAISADLARLPPPPAPDTEVLALEAAENYDREASAALQTELAQHTRFMEQLRIAQRDAQAAQETRDRLRERVNSDERKTQLSSADRGLAQARSDLRDVQDTIADLEARAKAIDLPQLRQDLERVALSAKNERARFDQVDERLRTLRVEVQVVGAAGLEESLATLQVKQAALATRVGQFARQVEVLDYLLNLLKRRREEIQRRLLAPLQARVDHYLRLLFPDQRLLIGEELVPDGLVANDSGRCIGTFEEQSFGTREQLALVCRLAYADLLKVSGKPTLLMLDDALVHSDASRLAQLKRVLFDAAQRHQILLMTCHPERWRDLGASTREMEALSA